MRNRVKHLLLLRQAEVVSLFVSVLTSQLEALLSSALVASRAKLQRC